MIWIPITLAPEGDHNNCIWLTDGEQLWRGWHDAEGWHDRAEWAGENKSMVGNFGRTAPKAWMSPLAENTIPLPEELDDAGKQLIDAIDEDALPAQAGMWVHADGVGWKYLVVTPGIEIVQQGLPAIFDSRRVSQAMVLEDVLVVGPNNFMFQVLSKLVKGARNSKTVFRGPEVGCPPHPKGYANHIADDGTPMAFWMRVNAVMYRSLKTLDGSDFKRPAPLPDAISRNYGAGSPQIPLGHNKAPQIDAGPLNG